MELLIKFTGEIFEIIIVIAGILRELISTERVLIASQQIISLINVLL